jgi:MoxR-like ATPase
MADDLSYPWFRRGLPGTGTGPVSAEKVPTLGRLKAEDPTGYEADPDLSHAVNVALALGMPLLLTGEPGTGKTRLADAVAHDLSCPLHRFDTKSTSQARDLFYTYDALTAFKMREATDAREFITYQALGRAILEAFPSTDPRLEPLLPPQVSGGYRHPGAPRRSVVLIDEIDKAPRDFPNDLLNEIDRLVFSVAELRGAGSPGADGGEGVAAQFRPIVILTSNSEKGLPDAFLRRCIYYDIPFPDRERMAQIVANRVGEIEAGHPLLTDALDIFYRLRSSEVKLGLRKKPSTAELINWLQILRMRGVRPDQSLRGLPDLVRETLSTLVKTTQDRKDARDEIDRWLVGRDKA